MIDRYSHQQLTQIWSEANNWLLCQDIELAVVAVKNARGELPEGTHYRMRSQLMTAPIDLVYITANERKLDHDYNAFLAERARHLDADLRQYLHEDLTTYDGREPAFGRMLRNSVEIVESFFPKLDQTLANLARQYRYTPMLGRTHGQGARIQTFGKRCLTALQELRLAHQILKSNKWVLEFSKLSGGVGNYGSLHPDIERETLMMLEFKPFIGASQIVPRLLYAPIAMSLCQLTLALADIAMDIRLGARSPNPIFQEPFGKEQMGSSVFPQKKNTIKTEKTTGMGRLAKGFTMPLLDNIETWEERAIEQSSVERVAWPDLFQVTVHALETMAKILAGLNVYPDRMLLELQESRGCYAADEAKKQLVNIGSSVGLEPDQCYRIVQLAAFNVFEPSQHALTVRNDPPQSLRDADDLFLWNPQLTTTWDSIENVIGEGRLRVNGELKADADQVQVWNGQLKQVFANAGNARRWRMTFKPSYLLQHEPYLYQEILGV